MTYHIASPSPEALRSINLNYDNGTSSNCLDTLIQHQYIMNAHERINAERKKGMDFKSQLKQARKITSGIVFKSGSSRLGKSLMDVQIEMLHEKQRKKMRNHF